MSAQPKATLEKILELLHFPSVVEEHVLEDGVLLEVKNEELTILLIQQYAEKNHDFDWLTYIQT